MKAHYQALSRTEHANLHWLRYSDYLFASDDSFTPLAVQELPKACVCLPTGFMLEESGFRLVAIQGVEDHQNLLVDEHGRWLAPYTPAIYRSYPFALGTAEEGQRLLCIDSASALITAGQGERFFDEDGSPSTPVQQVLQFLSLLDDNLQLTQRLCKQLSQHQLIQPWSFNIQTDQGVQTISGFYGINESSLKTLEPPVLSELAASGALGLAYCQLISMQHIQRLQTLAANRAGLQNPAAAQELDLDQFFDGDDDLFKF